MRKIALLIGNSNYTNFKPLACAANDVDRLAKHLTNFGFKCSTYKDLNIKEMRKSINVFCNVMVKNDVALFYFSGHGFQIDEKNFITAIDSDFDKDDIDGDNYDIQKLLDNYNQADIATKIMILDACRTNPLKKGTKGFTSFKTLALSYSPANTIISYSTSPGDPAYAGKNVSYYTSALLQHIDKSDLPIEELFKKTRKSLSEDTNNEQISWELTSLIEPFYFNKSATMVSYIYNLEAKTDKYYISNDENIKKVIEKLKSHDWNVQNIAFDKLKKINISELNIEDLFVLGRNIYQTACGGTVWGCRTARKWIDNLSKNVPNRTTGLHILNGMVYEIYFDSEGNLRNYHFKTGYIEQVMKACEAYEECVNFIQNELKTYSDRVFYIPNRDEKCILDLEYTKYDDDFNIISSLICNNRYLEIDCIEATNTGYISDEYFKEVFAIPKNKLVLNYKKSKKTIIAPGSNNHFRYLEIT